MQPFRDELDEDQVELGHGDEPGPDAVNVAVANGRQRLEPGSCGKAAQGIARGLTILTGTDCRPRAGHESSAGRDIDLGLLLYQAFERDFSEPGRRCGVERSSAGCGQQFPPDRLARRPAAIIENGHDFQIGLALGDRGEPLPDPFHKRCADHTVTAYFHAIRVGPISVKIECGPRGYATRHAMWRKMIRALRNPCGAALEPNFCMISAGKSVARSSGPRVDAVWPEGPHQCAIPHCIHAGEA